MNEGREQILWQLYAFDYGMQIGAYWDPGVTWKIDFVVCIELKKEKILGILNTSKLTSVTNILVVL